MPELFREPESPAQEDKEGEENNPALQAPGGEIVYSEHIPRHYPIQWEIFNRLPLNPEQQEAVLKDLGIVPPKLTRDKAVTTRDS